VHEMARVMIRACQAVHVQCVSVCVQSRGVLHELHLHWKGVWCSGWCVVDPDGWEAQLQLYLAGLAGRA
jgi:hypothetical protein